MIFGSANPRGGISPASAVLMAALVSLSFNVDQIFVRGHGYMYTPRSRNWVAHEDGTDTAGVPGSPSKEYCFHCLNSNNGLCGVGNDAKQDYDVWLDSSGQAMPWASQNTYQEGQDIIVKSHLSTHHRGHMTLTACPDALTQDCLNNSTNQLEFVSDVLYGMPKDLNYPERGYYAGGESDFEMKFKLPDGISGDQVILHWKYTTANSCYPEGYPTFVADSGRSDVWNAGVNQCTGYPMINGDRIMNENPEQFFNCAEITIIPGNTASSSTTTISTVNPPPNSSTSTTTTTSTSVSTVTATPGEGCCTIDYKNCSPTVSTGDCAESKEKCEGMCHKHWLDNGALTGCTAQWKECSVDSDCCPHMACTNNQCLFDESLTVPTPTPPTTQAPVASPVVNPTPGGLFSCSLGKGSSSIEALDAFYQRITQTVSTNPLTLSVIAEGGAAGDGSMVVSEAQAYGLLVSALALLSLNEGDSNYEDTKNKFYGYYNGWKKMCKNSIGFPSCQSPTYCQDDDGSWPCLPGWKHYGDLSAQVGSGAAPDGDEDAIVGMIIALKGVGSDSTKPSWYDEVKDWADRSCTQFLQDNTVLSSSGNHRLVKLGSCWGGFGGNGNNPSYHAPGHYRLMRDFQESIDSRAYTPPSYVNSDAWDMVIDTSYEFLATTQCSDTGLVPNWARVVENNNVLEKDPGHFSGSGTPQYEFGAEASRTMWRIAFDAAAYPEESAAQSLPFLAPLHEKLVANFDPAPSNTWAYFKEDSLQDCNTGEGFVSNVHGNWQWNGFMFGPVYSALIAGVAEEHFVNKGFDQQRMVDEACDRVDDDFSSATYYSLSWQVIAQMTLNGEVAKLAAPAAPTTSPPTGEPSSAPSKAPTDPCWSNNYKDCNLQGTNSCEAMWLPAGPQDNCVALWGDCSGQGDSCCDPAVCHGDSSSTNTRQCVPQAKSDAVASNSRALLSSGEQCIVCDDVPTSAMKSDGLECATADWIGASCSEDGNWIRNRFCRKTCFDIGRGYDGDVCCKEVVESQSVMLN